MKIEVSNGEILDKITILMIKSKKITDPSKLKEKRYGYPDHHDQYWSGSA
jgi:hypothetical protein